MKKCSLTIKDEVWCYFAGLDSDHQEFLWKTFSVFADGYLWMPAYKLGRWDGRIRFYEKTGKTYNRLLDKILPYIDGWGYEINFTDNRIAWENPNPPLKVLKYDAAGIAIDVEGADFMGPIELKPGSSFALRPYQVECIKLAVEAGSGFVIAGTGAGKCHSGSTLINVKVTPQVKEVIEHVRKDNLSCLPDKVIEKCKNFLELPVEQITCTFGELFAAISNLENHKFADDVEYFQHESIEIETAEGFSKVNGLIKKRALIVTVDLSDGTQVQCAGKHVLFRENGEEVFAEDLIAGDVILAKDGFRLVANVSFGGEQDVFDLEVDRLDHTYSTANGVLHHNTSITAGISHAYGTMDYKVITIVPSGDLVDQTATWYEQLGMDVGVYSGERKDIDHDHVVATWQSLQYNPSVLTGFNALIWDECFAGDTQILMHDQTCTKIKDVKIGDEVMAMGPDGQFTSKPVTNVHVNLPKSSGKMLRLFFDNGSSVDVTEDHEFYLTDGSKISAKNLDETSDICEFSLNKLHTSTEAIKGTTSCG